MRPLARRLLIAGAALLVSLGVAEAVLRARLRDLAAEPSFARVSERFRSNPLSILPKRPEGPYPIDGERRARPGENVNEQGFRGPAVAAQKPAGTRRVVCLGGSSVYGTSSSSDATTWPAFLQRALCADAPAEVLNGAVPGYQLEQSVARFEQMFLPLQPDLAILCNTYNDVVDGRSQRLGVMAGFEAVEPPQGWRAWLSRSALGVTLLEWMRDVRSPWADSPPDAAEHLRAVAQDVQERETARLAAEQALALDGRRPGDVLDRCFFPQDLRDYAASLERFVGLARAHGCEPVLVVEPLAVAPQDGEEAWQARGGVLRGYFPSGAVFAEVYGRYAAATREVAVRQGTRFLDAQVELSRTPGMFADVVHFTDAGAREFGFRLAELLRDGR